MTFVVDHDVERVTDGLIEKEDECSLLGYPSGNDTIWIRPAAVIAVTPER